MKNTVLVVAAHPDDEVLGAGGAILRHRLEGDQVAVLILGEGVTSRYNSRQEGLERGKDAIKKLREEMKAAHAVLGVDKTLALDLPDNRFDQVPLLDIVKTIEKFKNEVKPNIVYTHHHGDINIDHRQTFTAVVTACRPTVKESVDRILSFEVMSSTEWNAPYPDRSFIPNIFLEIDPHLDKKLEAMSCYKSELTDYPHPRSLESLRKNARYWALKTGLKAAEAFMLVRDRIGKIK